jgi:hypothetical protein
VDLDENLQFATFDFRYCDISTVVCLRTFERRDRHHDGVCLDIHANSYSHADTHSHSHPDRDSHAHSDPDSRSHLDEHATPAYGDRHDWPHTYHSGRSKAEVLFQGQDSSHRYSYHG